MKIGVISDTHLKEPDKALCDLGVDVFSDATMIIHAGDLTGLSVLNAFPGKTMIAVAGNSDNHVTKNSLPTIKIIEVCGYRIGLVHGWGPEKGIEDRIIHCFDNVHVIVYGHTHVATSHIKNGILMFNPGAYSGSFLFKNNRSVGILTICENEGVSGTIINL